MARARGTPAELHAADLPLSSRLVRVCSPTSGALVIGSAQPETDVASGEAFVRRRTGGGAVLVIPGNLLWIDVVVPAGDPLWDDDVGRSFLWLGDTWAAALSSLGVDAGTYRGGFCHTRWCRLVCFAGLGPGEVAVGDRKCVGLAQRRTRGGAWFQCAALLRWDADELLARLVVDDRDVALAELKDAAVGLDAAAEDLERAFLDALP